MGNQFQSYFQSIWKSRGSDSRVLMSSLSLPIQIVRFRITLIYLCSWTRWSRKNRASQAPKRPRYVILAESVRQCIILTKGVVFPRLDAIVDIPQPHGLWNVESVVLGRLRIESFPLGGQQNRHFYRPLWPNTDALIIVVDSNDRERFEDTKDQLEKMFREAPELSAVPMLIYANKQDLPMSLIPERVLESIMIDPMRNSNLRTRFCPLFRHLGIELMYLRIWNVDCEGSCALNRQGIHSGLQWLQHALKAPKV
jgi:hypothetical protein